MYFSLFCGRPDGLSHSGLRLTRRESVTFVAVVLALIAFGVVPRPLVDSRFAASDEILQTRQTNLRTSQ
jgi:NADH:ubiquinone oxidoreductase subunit 4 (subunit M)